MTESQGVHFYEEQIPIQVFSYKISIMFENTVLVTVSKTLYRTTRF